MQNQYSKIKSDLLKSGHPFEDSEFPAVPRSVYFSKNVNNIYWMRPTELIQNPKFIVDDVSRFDLDQGTLGDCWYVAAAATLATKAELFRKVVPLDQTFDRGDYAGIFRFNFWYYGEWKEVVVDDRLPTDRGRKLVFCSNRERPDEFWPALLEKAYAKLAGSYEALDGGLIEDAMVDFTGGIGQRLNLKDARGLPKNLFDVLLQSNSMNSLMGACIYATRETMENQLDNGLIIGHAYSVTDIVQFENNGVTVRLLRMRNPWGNREWRGRWSDRSTEWRNVSQKLKDKLQLVVQEDGEFWIPFEDVMQNFDVIQICHLPPSSETLENKKAWVGLKYNGTWTRGVNAGGSDYFRSHGSYWTNTQYSITLTSDQVDSSLNLAWKPKGKTGGDDDDGSDDVSQCCVIISLMQKPSKLARNRPRYQYTDMPILFDLYKVNDDAPKIQVYQSNHLTFLFRTGNDKEYYREVSNNFFLDPGKYVIIPSTAQQNVQAEYLLRIFTDSIADGRELDVKTERISEAKIPKDQLQMLFDKYAGSDSVVDARELRLLLNDAFRDELGTSNQFDLETCRSLMTVADKNNAGTLDNGELKHLWGELCIWRALYDQFDKDHTGHIDVAELKSIFKSLNFNLSNVVLKSIVKRYGGKQCKLSFNELVTVASKVMTVVDVFPGLCPDGNAGKASLTLDTLLQLSMFL